MQDYPMPEGRVEPPMNGDEYSTLIGSLERQRATFAWKFAGLPQEAMSVSVGRSAMTIGGLVKHVALCEHHSFGTKLWNLPLPTPFDVVDWKADPEWEFRTGSFDEPSYLKALWQSAVETARNHIARKYAVGGLDTLASLTYPDGRTPSLRRILLDLIEEYARHVGHLDLMRESFDGLTGEDPPNDRGQNL